MKKILHIVHHSNVLLINFNIEHSDTWSKKAFSHVNTLPFDRTWPVSTNSSMETNLNATLNHADSSLALQRHAYGDDPHNMANTIEDGSSSEDSTTSTPDCTEVVLDFREGKSCVYYLERSTSAKKGSAILRWGSTSKHAGKGSQPCKALRTST